MRSKKNTATAHPPVRSDLRSDLGWARPTIPRDVQAPMSVRRWRGRPRRSVISTTTSGRTIGPLTAVSPEPGRVDRRTWCPVGTRGGWCPSPRPRCSGSSASHPGDGGRERRNRHPGRAALAFGAWAEAFGHGQHVTTDGDQLIRSSDEAICFWRANGTGRSCSSSIAGSPTGHTGRLPTAPGLRRRLGRSEPARLAWPAGLASDPRGGRGLPLPGAGVGRPHRAGARHHGRAGHRRRRARGPHLRRWPRLSWPHDHAVRSRHGHPVDVALAPAGLARAQATGDLRAAEIPPGA